MMAFLFLIYLIALFLLLWKKQGLVLTILIVNFVLSMVAFLYYSTEFF